MPELLDDILKASIDGICVFDRDHRCTHWSPVLERLTGISAAAALGKSQGELFPEVESRPYALSFSAATDGAVIGIARESVAAVNEMLSLASHKLKTPLAALQIHLGSQLRNLRRGHIDRDSLEKSLASAIEQSTRMADTMNMLVDVSRIDSGRWKLDPTEFELGAVARHALHRLEHTAREAGCEVRGEIQSELHGRWDRVRLEEVFATLLANAFKHGAGKPVEFSVTGLGDHVQIVVSDGGGGIAPDDLPKVFARGPRTAIGLWIAKEIVHAHKGTIDVESSPAGSRFTVTLPKAAL